MKANLKNKFLVPIVVCVVICMGIRLLQGCGGFVTGEFVLLERK